MTTQTSSTPVESIPPATFWNKVGFWFPHVVAVGYALVILGAISTQFVGAKDMPCPLCVLQRMAMMLIGITAVWIIGLAKKNKLSVYAYVRAYGLMILAAILGIVMSTRQIFLHILPGDPGYGGTVLGLHLYTWALVTFLITLIYAAVMFTVEDATFPIAPASKGARRISDILVWVFIAVIAINVVLIFAEEGFNWVLPDDPTRYELLYQLGIRE
jgi:disulfide bond formation protein DsbB